MWLIDTDTLKLHSTYDTQHTPYAILSHTWGEDEISFQEFQDVDKDLLQQRPSFAKIKKTCDIAKSRRIKWAWCDQCCINKESSSELSEAINSMYQWYKDSQICFAYIADISSSSMSDYPTEGDRQRVVAGKLRYSRWISRGWTLQELIAPTEVEFYDVDWNFIGSRTGLVQSLSDMTNIDADVLLGTQTLASIPVGRKMSWAAGRQTTRAEDRAYSLLGIFGISMPLLYGEGYKAFQRLQQYLASEINDLSLFAWQASGLLHPAWGPGPSLLSGMFAESPDDFAFCARLKMHWDQSSEEFAVTNAGIRISRKALCRESTSDGMLLLDLHCVESSARTQHCARWLGVPLVKVKNIYLRYKPYSTEAVDSRLDWVPLHEEHPHPSAKVQNDRNINIYLKTFLPRSESLRMQSLFLDRTGIVITYHKELKGQVKDELRLPRSSCRADLKQDGVGNGVKQYSTFAFDVVGVENFFGMNKMRFKCAITAHTYGIVIVCCIQWNNPSSSYELRYGIFNLEDIFSSEDEERLSVATNVFSKHDWRTSKIEGQRHQTTSGRREDQLLRSVKDYIFARYSNDSGVMLQSRMPTSTRVLTNGQQRLRLRHVVRAEDGAEMGPDFPWIDGYHHLLLECVGKRVFTAM